MTPEELLTLSGERDRWQQHTLRREHAGYQAGYADGIEDGRRFEAAERDDAWNRVAAPMARSTPLNEIQQRRWGPGGREHFGDPRPGDFQGWKQAAA